MRCKFKTCALRALVCPEILLCKRQKGEDNFRFCILAVSLFYLGRVFLVRVVNATVHKVTARWLVPLLCLGIRSGKTADLSVCLFPRAMHTSIFFF